MERPGRRGHLAGSSEIGSPALPSWPAPERSRLRLITRVTVLIGTFVPGDRRETRLARSYVYMRGRWRPRRKGAMAKLRNRVLIGASGIAFVRAPLVRWAPLVWLEPGRSLLRIRLISAPLPVFHMT
jgi:hypothetical protein